MEELQRSLTQGLQANFPKSYARSLFPSGEILLKFRGRSNESLESCPLPPRGPSLNGKYFVRSQSGIIIPCADCPGPKGPFSALISQQISQFLS